MVIEIGSYASTVHAHLYGSASTMVLLPGCGTSDLPAGLLSAGVGGVTGLECSANAVTIMQRRHQGDVRARFLHLDATATGLPDGTFQVCLDKGTLDAIMADSSDSCRQTALSYLTEMERLLQHGGRFLCITLAQHHVLGALTQMFAAGGWALRFHDLTVTSSASVGRRGPAPPPVFVAVATKLRLIPFASAPCLLEVWAEGMEQPGRCANGVAMATWVRERQDYAAIRSQLSDLSVTEGPKRELSLELWSATTPSHPRYSLYIIDTMSRRGCTSPEKMFAVFIVPHGRECESMFGSEAGRAQLANDAGFSRLIVVLLLPGQDYGGMLVSGEEMNEGGSRLEAVQKELSPRMLELAPAGIPPEIKIPFLSVGVGVGWREVRFRGRSDLSGEFLVEDVGSTPEDMARPCHIYRRLVFLGSQNLLQSETRFVSVDKCEEENDVVEGGRKSEPTQHQEEQILHGGERKIDGRTGKDGVKKCDIGNVEINADGTSVGNPNKVCDEKVAGKKRNRRSKMKRNKNEKMGNETRRGGKCEDDAIKEVHHSTTNEIQGKRMVGERVANENYQRIVKEGGDTRKWKGDSEWKVLRVGMTDEEVDEEQRRTALLQGYRLEESYLPRGYQRAMLVTLSFIQPASLWRVVVVGLGGGALSRFLTHRLNSQLSLVTVEIDWELVSVAARWFGFFGDVVLGDGVQYVHWLAAQGHRIHALLIDADSKDAEGGLSCPPPAFLSLEFLSVARRVLMPGGILSLNLVTRDAKVRTEAVSKLVKAFPAVLSLDVPGLTNEIIACLPCGLAKRKVRGNRITKDKEANDAAERWGCDTGVLEGENASPLQVDRVPQLVREFEDRLKKAGPFPVMDLVDVASHLHVIK
uniref:eEF1A lysine and N-terminal methyltransferase-like isoform X2 n=1 Tax=Myxine glutinosa TaxID=7769 RepID=UPI00358E242F